MLGKFSSMFHGQKKAKTVYTKDSVIDLSTFADIDEEFALVTEFISDTLPLKIEHQFDGTCLKLQQGDRYYVFVSRQGRLAVIDSKERVILRDEIVTTSQIWALGLSSDEKHIFCAGEDPVIKKYKLDSLQIESEYPGHTGEVNSIDVFSNNQWMVSCSDDGTVRLWSLTQDQISKVLYSHTHKVYCLDLSENNAYIASGSQDGTSKIYEFSWSENAENGKEIATLDCESCVWAVKIAPSNKFVVTGDRCGNLVIWEFITWQKLRQYKENKRIRSIDISKDENLMITAGEDAKIYIWHLNKKRKPFVYEGHKAMIKSALLSHDQQFIVSLADDKSVMRWRIPFFEEKHILELTHDIVGIWGVGQLVVGLTANEIISWDLQGTLVSKLEVEKYDFYYVTSDCTLYLVTIESEKNSKFYSNVKEYSLNPIVMNKQAKIKTTKISSVTVSDSKKYLCVGELYKISVFLVQEDMKLFNSQLYHDDAIVKIIVSPCDLYLFSIGENMEIKMIDTVKMADTSQRNIICKISDYLGLDKEKIVDFYCCKDSSKLLIITSNELMIWSILSKTSIKKVALEHPATRLISSKFLDYFFIQTSDSIEFWSYKDFNLMTKMGIPSIETFTFTNNEQNIIIKTEAKMELSESPLFSKHFKIIGENVQGKLKKFCSYVKKIIDDKSDKYVDDYKYWMILPFMVNIQHIYAYFDYDEYLAQAYIPKVSNENPEKIVSFENAPYVLSANKHTPLSVSIFQEFPESAKIVLKALRKRWENDPFSLVTVSECLIQLNNFGLDGLQKLYDFALRKSFLKTLPSFSNDVALPIVFYSGNIEIDPTAVLGQADTSDGTAISFENTCFKINMSLGSSEGIDFMESLVYCKNEMIFETPLIRLILEEKWKKVRIVMLYQATLYLIFTILLSYYSTLPGDSDNFLLYPVIINGALLFYEIYQMFAGGLDYFKDIWNYIDIVRSALFFIFAGMIWTDNLPNHTNFLSLLLIITFIRGVTYFRIFGPTRYLINLLFEVFSDIPAFLVIFFYTILAFSFIFYSLLGVGTDKLYYVTLIETYSTTLGNSDTGGYSQLQWLFYLLITLFNFIIMLNLLISILSDTYTRVKNQQMIADGQELASMILEVEMMLFWRSKDNVRQFIHYCKESEAEEQSEYQAFTTKFKTMSMKCDVYEKDIMESLVKATAVKDCIKGKNDNIMALVEEIRKKHALDN